MIFLTAALALLAAEFSATACQDTCFTLEECLSIGIREGFEVRRSEVGRSNALEASKLSVLDLLPSLQLYAGDDWSFGRNVDMQELVITTDGKANSVSFSSAAVISANDLAQGIILRKAYKSEVLRSAGELENAVIETAIAITESYLRLLLAMQSCRNADSSYAAILQLRKKTAIEAEVGKVPYGTLAEIEAQLASEKAAAVKATGERHSAAMELAGKMNFDLEREIAVKPPEEDFIPGIEELPDDGQIALYIKRHPKMKAAEAALENARKQRQAALVELYPQLDFNLGYGTGYTNSGKSTFGKQLSDNLNPTVGIGLTIPINDGSSRLRQARQALSEVRKMEITLEQTRRETEIEIRGECLTALTSYEHFQACSENLRAMEISFHISEAKFDAGGISGSDYITSRKNYLNALAQYWQAAYEYIFRMKTIDFRLNHEKLLQRLAF